MFENLLKMFSLEKSSIDKKGQVGIGSIPDTLITIGVVGVIAVTMVIVLLTLGVSTSLETSNDGLGNITYDSSAIGIINDTIDTLEAPFDLLPLFGTILVLVIILGAVFMIYRSRQG